MTTPNEVTRVLITGASSGIGRQTALLFAAEGASLILAARGADALQDTADECVRAGAADVIAQPTDIGVAGDVQRLFDVAVDRLGGVDVVVQNAGIAAYGSITDVPLDIFAAVFRTNVFGAVAVSQAALQHFRTCGGGRLVVVGSLLGRAAVPLMSPYVISKFAVSALVRILRQETRGEPGITVHGIYPGAVDTPIYALSANYLGRLARVLPVRDRPQKVARAIVRSAGSDRASERQVGLANWPMLIGYRLLPRLFDRMAGFLLRSFSFTGGPLAATTGNALEPIHLPTRVAGRELT